jgi:hypothetical protein
MKLRDSYVSTPAFERGYSDAKNGRGYCNPYKQGTTEYVDYSDGYHAYQNEAY